MAQGITFDLKARVTGYESSLEQLKRAFDKIDPGSEIGKKLSKAIQDAENQLKGLNKNLTPHATNHTQIDNIVEKTNEAGEAIQNVINLMGNLTGRDLNIGSLGEEITKVIEQIETLQSEMGSVLNNNFVGFLKSPTEEAGKLRKVFLDLGFKIKDISNENALDILTKGLKEAQSEADKAAKALDQINEKLKKQQDAYQNKYGNNPFANENFSETDFATRLRAVKNPSEIIDSNKLEAIKQQMLEGLSNFDLKGKDDIAVNLLDNLFQGLTPDNIRQKLNVFTSTLSQEFKFSKESIRARLLNGRTDTQFANALLGVDEQQLEEAKASLSKQVEEIASALKPDQVAMIRSLIDEGQIEKAKSVTLVAMHTAYAEIKRQMEKDTKEIENLTKEQQEAERVKAEAVAKTTSISEGKDIYSKQIESLQSTVTEQQKKIDSLQKQLDDLTNARAQEIQSSNSNLNPNQYKITAEEANKYNKELDQIHEKEKLIGKVEGLVQRWFSIYAAVNMVNKAIHSIISTVRELDKTITEIAIVTDMTRDDLWGQMSDYTEMAHQYAASISGVYQVSQLYYQQGLQTADVMALTEETLKMARISGLGYAEATDYMTNAVRSFKMEMTDAQRVVDVYSEIAASSATSTTELATAMSKTASSAEAVGSSFENTTAMMAVMIEATRESATNIGSAMKSIISRYGEMTSDPSKLMDSEGEEMSLNKVDKALQSVGITIQDTNHQFREFDDVIAELAGKWDTIDNNTQRYEHHCVSISNI